MFITSAVMGRLAVRGIVAAVRQANYHSPDEFFGAWIAAACIGDDKKESFKKGSSGAVSVLAARLVVARSSSDLAL